MFELNQIIKIGYKMFVVTSLAIRPGQDRFAVTMRQVDFPGNRIRFNFYNGIKDNANCKMIDNMGTGYTLKIITYTTRKLTLETQTGNKIVLEAILSSILVRIAKGE